MDIVFNKLGYTAAIEAVYHGCLQSAMGEIQSEQAYIDNDGDVSPILSEIYCIWNIIDYKIMNVLIYRLL